MVGANIKQALNSVLPASANNEIYKRRLEALISEAMKGNFSNEDIREVITLVPNDPSHQKSVANGAKNED